MLDYISRYSFGLLLVLLAWASGTSCATYYQKQKDFNRSFEGGDLEKADLVLSKQKNVDRKKHRLVYYLDKGVVKHLLGQYEESNASFEQAFLFGEDYKKSLGSEAVSTLLNPNLNTYYGEDHEHILPLYYKALNYVQAGDLESALVECRRLNIRLDELSDRYKSKKKYRRDAFIHMIMGLFYEAQNDFNNAFIAYRNAYDIYKDDYAALFNFPIPHQLQIDLLRMAARNGFDSEQLRYEEEMQLKTPAPLPEGHGELIFFWHNGLGPVKDQRAITLALVKGVGGGIVFENPEEDMAFPFVLDGNQAASLFGLQTIRITFPTYKDRPTYFDQAELVDEDMNLVSLEEVEPVTSIARKCLSERMFWELSRSLIRVALREVVEAQIRKRNEGLGLLADIVGTLTESSDTRCWQTLPHAIHYARFALPSGRRNLKIRLKNKEGALLEESLSLDIQAGRVHFYDFSSMESSYEGLNAR